MPLKTKLESGQFAILAEMEPPKGTDVSAMVLNATRVKGDVDAFVVPEMSNAVMRMSALGGSVVLQGKGLETVMQMCCRDRNRLALQADLLAAYGCGITNIMAVTGEEPSYGDHHQARAVYDIDLPELLEVMQGLQAGRDMAGIELAGAPSFTVGATLNMGVDGVNLEREIDELAKKRSAGVAFFVTLAVFDVSAVESFLKKVDLNAVRIIPKVIMLKSAGMARYIDRNLPHVHIPAALIERIEHSPDKVRECMLIAAETVSRLRERGFAGALISPMGWEHRLPQVLEKL
jgi:5,10-methylenetetrahydrofolate reductase